LQKKKTGTVAQGVGSEFNPQYCKKREKKKKRQKGQGMWLRDTALAYKVCNPEDESLQSLQR
jgi:hypothetical protein